MPTNEVGLLRFSSGEEVCCRDRRWAGCLGDQSDELELEVFDGFESVLVDEELSLELELDDESLEDELDDDEESEPFELSLEEELELEPDDELDEPEDEPERESLR